MFQLSKINTKYSTVNTVIWVADVYDPEYVKVIDEIEKEIKRDEVNILLKHTWPIYNSLVEFKYILSTKDASVISRIKSLISDLLYIPVVLVYSEPVDEKTTMDGPFIVGMKEIIQYLVSKKFKVAVNSVALNIQEVLGVRYYKFSPKTEEGRPIYQRTSGNIVNMDEIVGYQVMSDNKLARYVIEDFYDKGIYNRGELGIKYINDVAFCYVGNTDLKRTFMIEAKKNIQDTIDQLMISGHFTYDFDISTLGDRDLLIQLAELWETDVIYKDDISRIVLRTDYDFLKSPDKWYRDTIQNIKHGSLPHITLLKNNWYNESKPEDDYTLFHGSTRTKYIFLYCAFKSFKTLTTYEPILANYIGDIHVYDNLSLTIPALRSHDVTTFKKKFADYLDSSKSWKLGEADDLIDVLIKRWWGLMKLNTPSLAFKNNYKYNIVYEVSNENLLRLTDREHNKARLNLIQNLQNYKQTNPELEHIIKLMIDNKPLKIKDIPQHLNSTFIIQGLSGIITFGPVPGLFTNISDVAVISDIPGTIKLIESPDGTTLDVNVDYNNGIIQHLFTITNYTGNKKDIQNTVENLWKSGHFISNWTRGAIKYLSTDTVITNINHDNLKLTYPELKTLKYN